MVGTSSPGTGRTCPCTQSRTTPRSSTSWRRSARAVCRGALNGGCAGERSRGLGWWLFLQTGGEAARLLRDPLGNVDRDEADKDNHHGHHVDDGALVGEAQVIE